MSLLNELPHRVTIRRPDYSQDDLGAVRGDFADVTTGVAAWVQNAGASEVREFDVRDEAVSHKVFFATAPGLLVGDQIYVESGPSFVGQTFRHVAGTDRSAGLGVLWAAFVDEVRDREAGR